MMPMTKPIARMLWVLYRVRRCDGCSIVVKALSPRTAAASWKGVAGNSKDKRVLILGEGEMSLRWPG